MASSTTDYIGKLVTEIDIPATVVLSEVYSGVGIAIDQGLFGIAQRDGGIKILLNGKLVWSSTTDLQGDRKCPKETATEKP